MGELWMSFSSYWEKSDFDILKVTCKTICYQCLLHTVDWWRKKSSLSQPSISHEHLQGVSFCTEHIYSEASPGVGVTKAPFVNFSVSKIFGLAKVPVRLFASHSYLTGVTAAELRQHLSNMNMIFNRQPVFWQCWTIGKLTERRKLV